MITTKDRSDSRFLRRFPIAEFDKHDHDSNLAGRLPEADLLSRHGLVCIAGAEFRHLLRHLTALRDSRRIPKRCVSISCSTRIAGHEEWAAECTVYGMRRHWTLNRCHHSIATTVTFGRSPNPDLSRAEELYQRTEYGRAIDALQALEGRDAAAYASAGQSVLHGGPVQTGRR